MTLTVVVLSRALEAMNVTLILTGLIPDRGKGPLIPNENKNESEIFIDVRHLFFDLFPFRSRSCFCLM